MARWAGVGTKCDASSPSLEEVDIVELVEFHGELECGLQVAHGVCGEQARARAARRAMPRPLPARTAHGAHRMPALHTALTARPHPRSRRLRLALLASGGSCAARPVSRSRRHRRTAHSAGTRNSFFNSGQRACAIRRAPSQT